MKFHKATDTNVTLCGKPTRGTVTTDQWRLVDCLSCRNIGNQPPRNPPPMVELDNQQPELELGDLDK